MATFNAKYWPSLDCAGTINPATGIYSSAEYLEYQVNQITSAALHPNGMIDVLGREFKGNQYCSLLKDPIYPFVAQVFSSDPNHNVPPTTIDPNNVLYEGIGADGIGEVASGVPLVAQMQPLVILPNDLTPGICVTRTSRISGPSAGPYTFEYTTEVTAAGVAWGPWADCVIVAYSEPVNNRYINYVFAATGAAGQPRGLVAFWSVLKSPTTGVLTPQLESFAISTGHT